MPLTRVKMAYLQTELISHTRKVCSLYKRSLRNLENFYYRKEQYRYRAVLMRDRFDRNRDINDMRVAKTLLINGEEELFQGMHPQPRKFANSPGGVCYGRTVHTPDWVLDFWHPLEKAQYPKYFATREQRKKEYLVFWEKQYGKPDKDPDHH